MITALVLVERSGEALATTLGALIPAVVDGLVGDAVVIARRPDAEVAKVAEVAGTSLVSDDPGISPWRAGAALARRPWLLCIADGDVPGEGWTRSVERFLVAATRDGHVLGRFSRSASPASAFTMIVERWWGTRTVRAGDLVQRRWLEADKPARVRPMRIGAAIERDASLR